MARFSSPTSGPGRGQRSQQTVLLLFALVAAGWGCDRRDVATPKPSNREATRAPEHQQQEHARRPGDRPRLKRPANRKTAPRKQPPSPPRPSLPPSYDDQRLAERGIHRIAGTHLILYTDIPTEKLQDCPELIDRLYPILVERFGELPAEPSAAPWRVVGHVMAEPELFGELGLFPAGELPKFRAGINRDNLFWMYDQPSAYYRRHLMLHEVTHCFMDAALGGRGPAWYAEGNAELFATHRVVDGKAHFGEIPQHKQEVQRLGRIEMVREDIAKFQGRTIENLAEISYEEFDDDHAYAWSWALCAMLDGHPAYRDRFRALHRFVRDPEFNVHFFRLFKDDWAALAEQWQVFAATLCYGYDIERCALDFRRGEALRAGETRAVSVASDRGWQNTGIEVEAKGRYRLAPHGRYSLADEPRVWWCEAGGISFRYVEGYPIGRLVACVRAQTPLDELSMSTMLDVLDVGLGTTLEPEVSGTLYVRINDDRGELADNRGELQLTIERERP